MNSLEKIETDQYLNSGAKERIGIWGRFGIYLSALILIFLLISHIYIVHSSGQDTSGEHGARQQWVC